MRQTLLMRHLPFPILLGAALLLLTACRKNTPLTPSITGKWRWVDYTGNLQPPPAPILGLTFYADNRFESTRNDTVLASGKYHEQNFGERMLFLERSSFGLRVSFSKDTLVLINTGYTDAAPQPIKKYVKY